MVTALEQFGNACLVALIVFGVLTIGCLLGIGLFMFSFWLAEKREEYAAWDCRDVASKAVQDVAWRVIGRCVAGDDRRMRARSLAEDAQVAELDRLWELST
jgi:hypothetical protein